MRAKYTSQSARFLYGSNNMEQLLKEHRFPCRSWGNISRQTHFSFRGHYLASRSPDLPIPDHILCSYVKSKVYETRPANIDNPKQRIRDCIQGIFKEMLQRVVIAFPSTVGVHWTTWWSPTKCNIQKVMIQINSHGHAMYLLVLIKFFHLALKCYFISKTVRCFWRTLHSPQRMSPVN